MYSPADARCEKRKEFVIALLASEKTITCESTRKLIVVFRKELEYCQNNDGQLRARFHLFNLDLCKLMLDNTQAIEAVSGNSRVLKNGVPVLKATTR